MQRLTFDQAEQSEATEDGFQRIREVTGLTDVMDIVHKLLGQKKQMQTKKNRCVLLIYGKGLLKRHFCLGSLLVFGGVLYKSNSKRCVLIWKGDVFRYFGKVKVGWWKSGGGNHDFLVNLGLTLWHILDEIELSDFSDFSV